MVIPTQFVNEIDRELSMALRNLKFSYRNQVKLNLINVKNVNEFKLSIHQQVFPFSWWLFLVKVPKNYPTVPLWIEPIQISDEMRKVFVIEDFRFKTIKLLIESVLIFCNKFQSNDHRSSKISFPSTMLNGKSNANLIQRLDYLLRYGAVQSPSMLVSGSNRRKVFNKFLESMESMHGRSTLSPSIPYSRLRAHGRWEVAHKRRQQDQPPTVSVFPTSKHKKASMTPGTAAASGGGSKVKFKKQHTPTGGGGAGMKRRTSHMKPGSAAYMQHRRASSVRNRPYKTGIERYIRCLELQCHLPHTSEYIFFRSGSKGEQDGDSLQALAHRQLLMSSLLDQHQRPTSAPPVAAQTCAFTDLEAGGERASIRQRGSSSGRSDLLAETVVQPVDSRKLFLRLMYTDDEEYDYDYEGQDGGVREMDESEYEDDGEEEWQERLPEEGDNSGGRGASAILLQKRQAPTSLMAFSDVRIRPRHCFWSSEEAGDIGSAVLQRSWSADSGAAMTVLTRRHQHVDTNRLETVSEMVLPPRPLHQHHQLPPRTTSFYHHHYHCPSPGDADTDKPFQDISQPSQQHRDIPLSTTQLPNSSKRQTSFLASSEPTSQQQQFSITSINLQNPSDHSSEPSSDQSKQSLSKVDFSEIPPCVPEGLKHILNYSENSTNQDNFTRDSKDVQNRYDVSAHEISENPACTHDLSKQPLNISDYSEKSPILNISKYSEIFQNLSDQTIFEGDVSGTPTSAHVPPTQSISFPDSSRRPKNKEDVSNSSKNIQDRSAKSFEKSKQSIQQIESSETSVYAIDIHNRQINLLESSTRMTDQSLSKSSETVKKMFEQTKNKLDISGTNIYSADGLNHPKNTSDYSQRSKYKEDLYRSSENVKTRLDQIGSIYETQEYVHDLYKHCTNLLDFPERSTRQENITGSFKSLQNSSDESIQISKLSIQEKVFIEGPVSTVIVYKQSTGVSAFSERIATQQNLPKLTENIQYQPDQAINEEDISGNAAWAYDLFKQPMNLAEYSEKSTFLNVSKSVDNIQNFSDETIHEKDTSGIPGSAHALSKSSLNVAEYSRISTNQKDITKTSENIQNCSDQSFQEDLFETPACTQDLSKRTMHVSEYTDRSVPHYELTKSLKYVHNSSDESLEPSKTCVKQKDLPENAIGAPNLYEYTRKVPNYSEKSTVQEEVNRSFENVQYHSTQSTLFQDSSEKPSQHPDLSRICSQMTEPFERASFPTDYCQRPMQVGSLPQEFDAVSKHRKTTYNLTNSLHQTTQSLDPPNAAANLPDRPPESLVNPDFFPDNVRESPRLHEPSKISSHIRPNSSHSLVSSLSDVPRPNSSQDSKSRSSSLSDISHPVSLRPAIHQPPYNTPQDEDLRPGPLNMTSSSQPITHSLPNTLVNISRVDAVRELCMRIVQPANCSDRHLSREIEFTLDINLDSSAERAVLDFLAIPTPWTAVPRLQFIVPVSRVVSERPCILLKDATTQNYRGKERFLRLHRIKPSSIIHSLFSQEDSYKRQLADLDRSLYFGSWLENQSWPAPQLMGYLRLAHASAQLARVRLFLREYLGCQPIPASCSDSSDISVCRCPLSADAVDLLDYLSYSIHQHASQIR